MKNTLTSLALAGTLALGLTGCDTKEDYVFNGKIDGEEITLRQPSVFTILTVKKADGRTLEYLRQYDWSPEVTVITQGTTNKYGSWTFADWDKVKGDVGMSFSNYMTKIETEMARTEKDKKDSLLKKAIEDIK